MHAGIMCYNQVVTAFPCMPLKQPFAQHMHGTIETYKFQASRQAKKQKDRAGNWCMAKQSYKPRVATPADIHRDSKLGGASIQSAG